jgi:S-DNA-T family DNA segregation ATPase FtsK/SpoIIIE
MGRKKRNKPAPAGADKKPARPAPAPVATDGPRTKRFWRYGFIIALTGVVVLAWLSMLSYSPTDPPAPLVSPPKSPVDNAAGVVGAALAYFLHYWLGGGVYMAMVFATVAAVVLVLGGKIADVPWRAVGLVLMVTATSAAIYLSEPELSSDPYTGSAGVLGIAAGRFLHGRFAGASWVFVAVSFTIGLMFAADRLVLQIPRLGREFWRKRRAAAQARAEARHAARDARQTAKAARSAKAVVAADSAGRGPSAGKVAPAAEKAVALAVKLKETLAAASKGGAGAELARGAVKPPIAEPLPPRAAPPANDLPARARPVQAGGKKGKQYELPPTDLLAVPVGGYAEIQKQQAEQRQEVLQQMLVDFNVAAEVVGHMTGPVITIYELQLAPGVKVSQVATLATDIARSLAVPGVRIVPPRFGKDTVGIEVPNLQKEIVRIRELMELRPDAEGKMHLPLYLGKDAAGESIVADLASMPHMLIAGTTGSGKSVCINSILMSILMTRTPEDVKLILVDPKMVEMAAFERLPHLLCPIVNDMRNAEDILEWAATKMDERYEMLKEAGVRNLASYNRLGAEELYARLGAETDEDKASIPVRVPHYVIVIDELADMMMTSGKEVEMHIIRIAQKARAVGIHLVLATQRPTANVVTGLIKSNMPCRISFRVASRQESRIVLDQNGAEVLLGQGDMLFLQPGTSSLIRAQGAYVDDTEIRPVVKRLRGTGEPEYNHALMRLHASPPSGESDGGEKDELFDKAVEIVLTTERGSVSLLQRRLQVGYSRASRIIDQMAEAGLLGDYKGSQARECLMTLDEWRQFKKSVEADQDGSSALDGTPTSV